MRSVDTHTEEPRPPWAAGISWRDDRYQIVVLSGDGQPAAPLVEFTPREVSRLVKVLLAARERARGQLTCVIDSTTGALERHLVEAGLSLYRADPWQTGERLASGSAPAAVLAELGRAARPALSLLTVGGGALADRDDEAERRNRACADSEAALTGAGQLVAGGLGTAPEIALTFDDGPSPEFTTRVLEVLRRYHALATFFCVGLNAIAFPETLELVAADGHEIGNHTWSHPYLPDLSYDEVSLQLERTNEAVERVTGHQPTLFRPPYGGRSPQVLRWVAATGMRTVLWNAEADDWARPGPYAIRAELLGQVSSGSIALLHDGGGDRSQTVEALPAILAELSARGYSFVSVRRFLHGCLEGDVDHRHGCAAPE
jgi:peptidoglycan-N-acetylglucosamine deacetylase